MANVLSDGAPEPEVPGKARGAAPREGKEQYGLTEKGKPGEKSLRGEEEVEVGLLKWQRGR